MGQILRGFFLWRYSIVIWFPSMTPLMCLINISTYLKSIENVPKWYICISLISETVYQKRLLHHLMYVLHWLNWYIAHKCLYAFWLVNKSLNLKDWQWKSDWQRDTRLVILWDKEWLSWLKICKFLVENVMFDFATQSLKFILTQTPTFVWKKNSDDLRIKHLHFKDF